MKSLKVRLTILLGVSLVASTAFAATWTTAAKVTNVLSGTLGGNVEIVGLPKANAACTSANISFKSDWSDTTKTLQLAMAALLSGRKLSCLVDTTCDGADQKGLMCSLQ